METKRDWSLLQPAKRDQACRGQGCGPILRAVADLVLDIADVKKTYRGGTEALKGVSLSVPAGSVFGLLGPNGAGKSTLVKILTTIIRPSRCQGTMLGQPIGHKPTLSRVGYLPEHARFPSYLTGRQVLQFSAGLCGLSGGSVRNRVEGLLERMGMKDWADQKIGRYSKGMKQRVGIGQALVNEPDLVLLDEPTDGVDPAGRRDIRNLIRELKEEGRTVFINSHLLGELEMMCDHVAILSKGELSASGELNELMRGSAEYRVDFDGQLGPDLIGELARQGLSVDSGRISVATGDPAEVMPVVDALRKGGVTIREIRLHTMSLEEFFLETVGDDGPGGVNRKLERKS